jgi:hypothetical protein
MKIHIKSNEAVTKGREYYFLKPASKVVEGDINF